MIAKLGLLLDMTAGVLVAEGCAPKRVFQSVNRG